MKTAYPRAAAGKTDTPQPRPLTPKQQRFVDEYLVDLNATAAARRAGYSARTAEWQGPQLLGKTHVAALVAKRMSDRAARTEITQDRVLKELARIAFFDIRRLYNDDGSLKKPSDLDDEAAAVLAGIDVVEMAGGMAVGGEDGEVRHVPMFTKKAKVFDKGAALSLAMRHLGMLTDKTELTGANGGPVQTQAVPMPNIKAALERVRSRPKG